MDAVEFAWWSDRPLTRVIVIHCDKAPVWDDVHTFITRFFKRAGKWLRLNGAPVAYVWVLEIPESGGLNLHILIHVPLSLRALFAKSQRHFFKGAGDTWCKGVMSPMRLAPR